MVQMMKQLIICVITVPSHQMFGQHSTAFTFKRKLTKSSYYSFPLTMNNNMLHNTVSQGWRSVTISRFIQKLAVLHVYKHDAAQILYACKHTT